MITKSEAALLKKTIDRYGKASEEAYSQPMYDEMRVRIAKQIHDILFNIVDMLTEEGEK